jgi:hypothetical protein
MEYVDGENLGSRRRRIGRFPQDRAVAIARQLCAGVVAARGAELIPARTSSARNVAALATSNRKLL